MEVKEGHNDMFKENLTRDKVLLHHDLNNHLDMDKEDQDHLNMDLHLLEMDLDHLEETHINHLKRNKVNHDMAKDNLDMDKAPHDTDKEDHKATDDMAIDQGKERVKSLIIQNHKLELEKESLDNIQRMGKRVHH